MGHLTDGHSQKRWQKVDISYFRLLSDYHLVIIQLLSDYRPIIVFLIKNEAAQHFCTETLLSYMF